MHNFNDINWQDNIDVIPLKCKTAVQGCLKLVLPANNLCVFFRSGKIPKRTSDDTDCSCVGVVEDPCFRIPNFNKGEQMWLLSFTLVT